MPKREQGRLLPDNLLNELQASELVCSAREIQQAPHTRVLGNWFNSFSAVMKHHWGPEVPALTCMCSFHVVKNELLSDSTECFEVLL